MSTKCIMATAIKDGEGKFVFVPCGKCSGCLARRASAWSFRLLQQEKYSSSAYFITLTYDSIHVPISRNGFLELRKSDLQGLFKRVRRTHDYNGVSASERCIKYFAVGEYGGRFKRPHYHVLLFNAELELMFSKGDILLLKRSEFNGKQVVRMKQWDKGHVTVGKVEGASVGYVMKYISEPVKNFKLNNDSCRPFSIMSNGLGIGYLNQEMFNYHHEDLVNRMFCNVDGKKITMPRYYKDRLYNNSERKEIKEALRMKFVDDLLEDILSISGINERDEQQHDIAQRIIFDQQKNFNNIKKLKQCKKLKKLRLQQLAMAR